MNPRLQARILVCLGVGIGGVIAGCGRPPSHFVPVQDLVPFATERVPGYHVVSSGETLYAIAWLYQRDHRELAQWNGLKTPYTLRPGQKLRLRAPSSPQAARSMVHTVRSKRPPSASTLHWVWPVRGAQSVSPIKQRHALLIQGRLKQPIYASASGTVVYAGHGLKDYGQLLILKHDHNWLSAYAFNHTLCVKEGSRVQVGQKIAEMGYKERRMAALHFEMRHGGRAVDPTRYLPQS